ncbi:ABC transporter G family member 35-like protein [Tanacetum coccineum]
MQPTKVHYVSSKQLPIVFMMEGGFMLPRTQIPNWWEWGYWLSPLSYGFKAFSVNEFLAPRWMNKRSLDNATTLGEAILENQDIPIQESWFWIGLFSILGFGILFNILFTFSLMYFDRKFPSSTPLRHTLYFSKYYKRYSLTNLPSCPNGQSTLGIPQASISKEAASGMETQQGD